MFGLSGQELALILLIVLILFGGKKIPELMRSLGSGLREFRKASSDAMEDIKRASGAEGPDTETPSERVS